MTKFGRGNQTLNSQMLTQSLNSSLGRLRVGQVFGLSIHNRKISEITEEIFITANNSKVEGKISKFGWCAEWDKLPINKLRDFDYVMLPINPFLANFTE